MFAVVILGISLLSVWTTVILSRKGYQRKEIIDLLKEMVGNSLSLFSNLKSLIKILIEESKDNDLKAALEPKKGKLDLIQTKDIKTRKAA